LKLQIEKAIFGKIFNNVTNQLKPGVSEANNIRQKT
jgi:hypothetical protein